MQSNILIAGAGIAGPTLAYGLARAGFHPMVVERAPILRTGGHPVDLWGSAVDVLEQMGILPMVEAARTQNDRGIMISPGHRPVELDLRRLAVSIADRHIEVMRGDLVRILHEQTKDSVEYVFGNAITGLDEQPDGITASFAHGPPRRFSLVVGADGLHSSVRRLVFGAEQAFRHDLGGYIAGYTVPDDLKLDGRIVRYMAPNKTAAAFPIRQSGEAGIVFLFRSDAELRYGDHDIDAQQRLLRMVFAHDGWEIPRLLASMERASDFYFDSISQIWMDRWSRGRVTLVGDAGYAPAPAVGGGTSLAVVGAQVLVGSLTAHRDDYTAAYQHYERRLRDAVVRSRGVGPVVLRTLIPRFGTEIWIGMKAGPLVLRLPSWLQQRVPLLPRAAAQGLNAIATVSLTETCRDAEVA